MKGLFGWVGFNQRRDPLPPRAARAPARSKFNFWRLWNFALEGITSFSTAPLRLATYLGLADGAGRLRSTAAGSSLKALLWGDPVAGWPTMMAVILFLGGVQLIALGLIGEYLGRLYDESKQRPLYLVDAWQPAAGVSSAQHTRATKERAMRTVRQLLEAKAPEVYAIGPDAPVIDAIRLMAEKRIGAVLVMQGGRLVGHPFRARLRAQDRAAGALVGGHAGARHHDRRRRHRRPRRHAPTIACRSSPNGASATCRCSHGGEVLGVVSIGDLVKAVIEDQQLELDQLQRYIAS